MPQQVKRTNFVTSVDNSSKQMQQTSGSSCSNRNGGDATAVDEVLAVDVAAVDEGAMDEVVVAVLVSFLFMVCDHCDRSIGLE